MKFSIHLNSSSWQGFMSEKYLTEKHLTECRHSNVFIITELRSFAFQDLCQKHEECKEAKTVFVHSTSHIFRLVLKPNFQSFNSHRRSFHWQNGFVLTNNVSSHYQNHFPCLWRIPLIIWKWEKMEILCKMNSFVRQCALFLQSAFMKLFPLGLICQDCCNLNMTNLEQNGLKCNQNQ